MVQIAVCGHIGLSGEEGTFGEVVDLCARDAGFDEVALEGFENPLDLIDALTDAKAASSRDVVVIGTSLAGMAGIELLRELRNEGCTQRVVLCSDGYDDAAEALDLRVDGYLVEPVETGTLRTVLTKLLTRVRELHDVSVVMSLREGTRRIRLANLLYAETKDHDQLLHMADGTTYTMPASSQRFFDVLEKSGMFFKAGSSYIVSLRAIRHVDARQSVAVLVDGTTVSIPRRVRKALEEAILA